MSSIISIYFPIGFGLQILLIFVVEKCLWLLIFCRMHFESSGISFQFCLWIILKGPVENVHMLTWGYTRFRRLQVEMLTSHVNMLTFSTGPLVFANLRIHTALFTFLGIHIVFCCVHSLCYWITGSSQIHYKSSQNLIALIPKNSAACLGTWCHEPCNLNFKKALSTLSQRSCGHYDHHHGGERGEILIPEIRCVAGCRCPLFFSLSVHRCPYTLRLTVCWMNVSEQTFHGLTSTSTSRRCWVWHLQPGGDGESRCCYRMKRRKPVISAALQAFARWVIAW